MGVRLLGAAVAARWLRCAVSLGGLQWVAALQAVGGLGGCRVRWRCAPAAASAIGAPLRQRRAAATSAVLEDLWLLDRLCVEGLEQQSGGVLGCPTKGTLSGGIIEVAGINSPINRSISCEAGRSNDCRSHAPIPTSRQTRVLAGRSRLGVLRVPDATVTAGQRAGC